MIYEKALPRIDNILWLRKLSGPFPTTAGEILDTANRWNFSRSTTDFLRLFPEKEEFGDRNSFLRLCEEMELAIRGSRTVQYKNPEM
ncbi:MAG TPA: hypothetical protein VMR18_00110 [Candidatus Saccharimonadales bacterium]|nr:hypothetical protein [Candidatus Saccharimonadales bacterium]